VQKSRVKPFKAAAFCFQLRWSSPPRLYQKNSPQYKVERRTNRVQYSAIAFLWKAAFFVPYVHARWLSRLAMVIFIAFSIVRARCLGVIEASYHDTDTRWMSERNCNLGLPNLLGGNPYACA